MEQGLAWIGSRRLGPPFGGAHWLGRHPLTARTPRLRAGLQEGDEEAATSLCPAPPASSVACAAPLGCSRLLSALSRLPAAPAWARRRRRRVGAGVIRIRGSASSLSGETLAQVLAVTAGDPAGRAWGGEGRWLSAYGTPGWLREGAWCGGPAGVTFGGDGSGRAGPRAVVSGLVEPSEGLASGRACAEPGAPRVACSLGPWVGFGMQKDAGVVSPGFRRGVSGCGK